MKNRIISFDLMRGGMIFYVIILHALIQRVFASQPSEFEGVIDKLPLIVIILMTPIILISLWGTLFTLIGGASAIYSMGMKVKKNRSDLAEATKDRLLNSLTLYIIYILNNILFSTKGVENGFSTYSLLTGYFETGILQLPSFYAIISSNTLESIAFINAFCAILAYFLWNKNGFDGKKTRSFLVKLAIVVVVISALLRNFLGNPSQYQEILISKKFYLLYVIFMRLYAVRFAIFPVLSFGLFGAVIGVMLVDKPSYSQIAKTGFGFGIVFISLFIQSIINGFDIIAHFPDEFVPLELTFLNLGLQLILLTSLLWFFDFKKSKSHLSTKKKVNQPLIFIQRYSNFSLTIYILEPFIASIVYSIFLKFTIQPISENISLITLFLTIIVLFWYGSLKIWDKFNRKFSIEWIMAKMKQEFLLIMNSTIYFHFRTPTYPKLQNYFLTSVN